MVDLGNATKSRWRPLVLRCQWLVKAQITGFVWQIYHSSDETLWGLAQKVSGAMGPIASNCKFRLRINIAPLVGWEITETLPFCSLWPDNQNADNCNLSVVIILLLRLAQNPPLAITDFISFYGISTDKINSDNFGRLAVCLLQHLWYRSQTTNPNKNFWPN